MDNELVVLMPKSISCERNLFSRKPKNKEKTHTHTHTNKIKEIKRDCGGRGSAMMMQKVSKLSIMTVQIMCKAFGFHFSQNNRNI